MVATPSRDMFLAIPANEPGFINEVSGKVEEDFNRLLYPITDRLFYVPRRHRRHQPEGGLEGGFSRRSAPIPLSSAVHPRP